MYSQSTNKYRLEYPSVGDILSPDSERRTMQIIENQLWACARLHSGGHGVVRTGNFLLITGSGGSYKIICYEHKASGKPAIEAFISQIYCFSNDTIEWSNLSNNTTYYLYVRLVEAGDTQSSRLNKQIQTESNTTGVIPSDGLLVAIVHINEPGNTIIVEDPVGKITLPTLGNHLIDNQNPHTPWLYQDNLVVSGLNILDYIKYRNLQIDHLTVSRNSVISGNATILGDLTVSGVIRNQGNIIYELLQVQNLTIPGTFTAAWVNITSGMDVYGPSTFRRPVILTSGITIDGLDPSEAIPLINGENADHLHSHILGSISPGVKQIGFSPEYWNTINSGLINSGIFSTVRMYDRNLYQWWSITSGAIWNVTRFTLPQDFESVDRIKVTHGVGYVNSGNNVTVSVYDKDNNPVVVTGGVLSSQQLTTSNVTVSGGQLVPNYPVTLVTRMFSVSGAGTFLGDAEFLYIPTNGEKVIFDWNKNGSITASENHVDGLRVAPCDLMMEKVLVSQMIALSGASVFRINTGVAGSEPSDIYQSTNKPILTFGATGASYQGGQFAILESNKIIERGKVISAGFDSIASGSRDVSIQLVTHRI